MTDTTQPPAETLAIIEMLRSAEVQEGTTVFDHSAEEIGIAVMENHRAVLAALTRRAGGDAIPAGMKPWHGGDEAPADWDGGPVFTYDDSEGGGYELQPPRFGEGGECWQRHNNFVDIIAYTPKPPAGGDAEMKGWDHRYRPLAWGEVILDTDECRRDDGTWVTGICVGEKAPDPAYTSHRVYRRLVAPAGGDAIPAGEGEPVAWRWERRGRFGPEIGAWEQVFTPYPPDKWPEDDRRNIVPLYATPKPPAGGDAGAVEDSINAVLERWDAHSGDVDERKRLIARLRASFSAEGK